MDGEKETITDNFLSASELLEVKGVGNIAWEDLQQSEVSLPKIGKKYFEPNGSWLEAMQLDNGLRNRKRVVEIEKVERHSQLALAEWLPGIQKARVTKKSGQKWENFGYEEKAQLYLLPEEALLLLEMGSLELTWNGMPLSIQQAFAVLINVEHSKCTLDEYRVYSQLVRRGYRLQRIKEKPFMDNRSSNVVKRIITNMDGLWTPNTSPTEDKDTSGSNGFTSKSGNEQEESANSSIMDKEENGGSPKKLGIISDETILGSIKIVKDQPPPDNQSPKWPGTRIQRNVKLMPKRSDIVGSTNNLNADPTNHTSTDSVPEKRKNSEPPPAAELPSEKKSRPEVIELLSDDEIEVIPRPMTRMEILNTLPNLADSRDDSLVVEVHREYLPPGVKPFKEFYRFNRKRLLHMSEIDQQLQRKSARSNSTNSSRNQNNGADTNSPSHFYSQPNQFQATTITHFGDLNNGFAYRSSIGCQRQVGPRSYNYQQQNVSFHNSSFMGGAVVQSNYVNFVMDVMGSMVRSSMIRQQQFQGTTFCQNLQIIQQSSTPRFPFSQQNRFQPYSAYNSFYGHSMNNQYYNRRSSYHAASFQRGRGGYRNNYNNSNGSNNTELQRSMKQEEAVYQSSFTKLLGVESWSELKKKWRDESTITIEDEEPANLNDSMDGSDIQVVETVKPLVDSKGISSMLEVYDRLRIIKSASDRTVRSRKIDYHLSYDVYSANQHYKKSTPGTPICRLFVISSKKDACLDASKLQRLQQESKEVPVVVAFVSQSCISYVQAGVALLPNLS
ncbi:uncharacterized protein LOC106636022 [Copidosoma floridanum]|uniref:uncharacterized protein LOC106636022 n=1 Tax=Copidosoma floridanum TaxID=29053 RepID=UPI0006C958E8|nr:uncharacterized protein LOC106636022 [Copidosoma floridanum]